MSKENQQSGGKEIPEEFENWINEWLKKHLYYRGYQEPDLTNSAVVWSRTIAIAAYRHLSAHPPVVEGGLRWVSITDGCEMPEIDEFALWRTEEGNYFVKEIDKDDGPWWKGEEGTGNPFQVKCTHWAKITNPLNL
jgi:hypothetical protein